jgi:hypothetical protein
MTGNVLLVATESSVSVTVSTSPVPVMMPVMPA